MKSDKKVLVKVENLKKYYPVHGGVFRRITDWVKAVDDVSFEIYSGETLSLVGESGCGKTTVGRTIINLIDPTSGSVHFDGKNVFDLDPKSLKQLRREMQIIFQDPYASLDPRMSIASSLGEGLKIHRMGDSEERYGVVVDLLKKVGLEEYHAHRFPHEFSGGQRQRIGIAGALSLNPKFIVCDEPVSALDVSIQSQVLNLLKDLQEEFGLAYLFIAHNLSVVEHVSDRVAVMYLGKIVELSDRKYLFDNPMHPYTQALMSAVPVPDPDFKRERIILAGDVPSPLNPPAGCRFHPRCPHTMEICMQQEPELKQITPESRVACWKVNQDLGLD